MSILSINRTNFVENLHNVCDRYHKHVFCCLIFFFGGGGGGGAFDNTLNNYMLVFTAIEMKSI